VNMLPLRRRRIVLLGLICVLTQIQRGRGAPVCPHSVTPAGETICFVLLICVGVALRSQWQIPSRPSLCRTAQTLNLLDQILGPSPSHSIAAARSTITRHDSPLGLQRFVIGHVSMKRIQAERSSAFRVSIEDCHNTDHFDHDEPGGAGSAE